MTDLFDEIVAGLPTDPEAPTRDHSVTITLDIEGQKYRQRFILEPGFPEIKAEPEVEIQRIAYHLARMTAQTFINHYTHTQEVSE